MTEPLAERGRGAALRYNISYFCCMVPINMPRNGVTGV